MTDWIEIERKIISVMKTADERSLSTHQIGQRVEVHHSTAKKHLKLMEFHGVVRQTSNGRVTLWNLTDDNDVLEG
jgi:ribosomal protein S25